MNCQSSITTTLPHPNARLAPDSTLIEKALEHQLTGAIMARLLLRGQRYELLHGVCDRDGYDVVIEAGGVMRHIQLKAVVQGGKRASFSLSTRLATKPSGCAIWINWDPTTISFTDFRFFGAGPGQPLPHLGDRIPRNSRANSKGAKGARPDHREIPAGRFMRLRDLDELVDQLFGRTPRPEHDLIKRAMAVTPELGTAPWTTVVRNGDFSAIPDDIDWKSSNDLASLIDGYTLIATLGHDPKRFIEGQWLAAQATGLWSGGAAELWATVFLEHRARRLAGTEPAAEERALLDELVRQLREALA